MPSADNLLSGYVRFDAAVGGFKRGSFILCSGSPDADAGFFAANVLSRALSTGEGGAIVLTTTTPADFRKAAYKKKMFFSKFEESGDFCFVDAYSRIVGVKEGLERVVNGPSDLAGIIANVAQCNAKLFRKGAPSVFVIDSLSGLAVHNSGPMLLQFFDSLADVLKRADSTLFIVLVEPFEDPSILEGLSRLVDVRLELKRDGGKTFASVGGQQWIELEGKVGGPA